MKKGTSDDGDGDGNGNNGSQHHCLQIHQININHVVTQGKDQKLQFEMILLYRMCILNESSHNICEREIDNQSHIITLHTLYKMAIWYNRVCCTKHSSHRDKHNKKNACWEHPYHHHCNRCRRRCCWRLQM